MSDNRTGGSLRRDEARVTAAEWFADGQRTWYDPNAARVLTEDEAAATPHAPRVFERVAAAEHHAESADIARTGGADAGVICRPDQR